MRSLLLALLLPALAQEAEPAVQDVIAEVSAGEVVAVFRGETVPEGIDASFGIRSLSFRFPDGSEFPYKPRGELYHSDWFTGIFSPDGRYVLLPQDHYGPYHVVEVAKLDPYLSGGEPLAVVGHDPGQGRGAWVHTGARWANKRTVVYKAGLEDMKSFRFQVPEE